MARTKKTESTKRFYNIFGGTFRQRLKEEQEGCITRTNKNNKVVHEMEFAELSGKLSKCYTYEHEEFGHMLVIELSDSDGTEVIETSMNSAIADSFMNRLLNLKLNVEVCLRPYEFIPKGEEKEKKGMVVMQGGKKVEPKFTKEAPGDLPQMVLITKGPKKGKWNNDDRQEYWMKELTVITQNLLTLSSSEGVVVESGE